MSEIKHKEKIQQLLKDMFREDWMNDEDWNEFERLFLIKNNLDIQSLSNDLDIGVTNGYSIDDQINFIKKVFLSLK